jgi:hypothetical protein
MQKAFKFYSVSPFFDIFFVSRLLIVKSLFCGKTTQTPFIFFQEPYQKAYFSHAMGITTSPMISLHILRPTRPPGQKKKK